MFDYYIYCYTEIVIKTLRYGFLVLQIYYKANGIYALFDILQRLYANTFFPLIQVYLLSVILDLLSTGQRLTFTSIAWVIYLWIAANLLKVILTPLGLIRGAGYEFATNDYIELQIDKKLNCLDPAVFESTKFQNLLAQMEGVKGTMTTSVYRTLNFLNDLVMLITAAVVVWTKFPIFVPIIIFATVPAFLSFNKLRDDTWIYMSHERGILMRIFQYIRLTLSNPSTSKEIAIYKNGDSLLERFKRVHRPYYKRFMKENNKSLSNIILSSLAQVTAFAFTQGINLAAVFAGKLAIGQFTLYFQQSLNLMQGAEGVLDNYSSMSMRNKSIDNYLEFLSYPNSIVLPKKAELIFGDPNPPIIEFKHVTFLYPDSERPILKDFSLVIKNGEKIALVGENGAGKSTLIKLLLRFYDVTEGEILINNVNIKEIDLGEWYKKIGALFQDFIKYQFTFKENVVFGDLSKKDDLTGIKIAIKKSGAESFVEDLPKGLDQIVGKTFEEGVDLSGGQWQKLALARAFFRDAPILILDEPTSAIDAKAEYEIFENVQKLQKDKTVIIISHRFSTVRNADRILVLDEGRIVEEGNHEKLMKKKGLYAELFNIQAQGYK